MGMVSQPKPGLNTYISGLYTQPHIFCANGELDEICIDFTMAGYYRFFSLPPSCYYFDDNILSVSFGKQAAPLFEYIFSHDDLQARGQGIEQFLLFCLSQTKRDAQDYHYLLAQNTECFSARALADQLQLSERNMQRLFRKHFTTTPKQYLRIQRFRKVVNTLKAPLIDSKIVSWEQLAYNCGYFDYSHLYRDLQQLTGRNPSGFLHSLQSINDTVTVGVEYIH